MVHKSGCSFPRISSNVCKVISKYGYTRPTPIQEKAIPAIKTGKNILLIAPTGSGKTEAVLFPLFDEMIRTNNTSGPNAFPLMVYITPLRALNRDILIRMKKISENIGLRVVVKHGDTSQTERKEFIDMPPHWFITTPESFVMMLSNDKLRHLMSNLRYVVVDELHEIIDNKRGAALSLALARLSRLVANRMQFVGLSATIPKKDILIYKRFFPEKDLIVIIDESSHRELEIELRIPPLQQYDRIEGTNKWIDWLADNIYDILSGHNNAIIFTNTRDLAESLGNYFNKKYGDKHDVMVHHGSLSKRIRQEVEEKLKKGTIKAVISTSSLELGIDIGSIDVVIQVGSPRQVVRLLQRAGRSGHKLHEKSKAVILAEPNLDDIFESLVIAIRSKQGKLERTAYPNKPLDVLLHGLVGEAIAEKKVYLDEFTDMARTVLYFEDIAYDDIGKIVEHGDSIGVLRKEGDSIIRESRRSRSYYYKTTMITESRRIKVESLSGELIGYLDEEFVVSRLSEDEFFILAGKVWKVTGVDNDKLIVEEASVPALPPKWEGELIPVSYEVANETCEKIYHTIKNGKIDGGEHVKIFGEHYLQSLIEEFQARKVVLPHPSFNLVEANKDGTILVFYTCGGTKVNDSISILLSYLLHRMRGVRVATSSDPYRVMIFSDNKNMTREFLEVVDYLKNLDDKNIENMIIEAVKNSQLFDYVLFQVAKRMGIYTEDTPLNLVKKSLKYIRDTIAGSEALNEILSTKIDIQRSINVLRKRILITHGSEDNDNLSKLTLYSRAFNSGFRVLTSVNNLTAPMMLEIFEKKLQGKEIILMCINCGSSFKKRLNELEEKPVCKKCGSRALVPLKMSEQQEFVSAIKKYIKNPKAKMEKKEWSIVNDAKKRANLVLSYGKPAVIALATYGIGPKNAARALSKLKLGWRSFIEELYNKEIEYIRNRKYWDE